MTITSGDFPAGYLIGAPSWRRSGIDREHVQSFKGRDLAGTPAIGGTPTEVVPSRIILEQQFNGQIVNNLVSTSVWFEDVHTLPRVMSLGLIIATIDVPAESFNAYRRASKTLQDFTNNDGPGIDYVGLTLPRVIGPLSGTGTNEKVRVDEEGPPTVDSTINFVWNAGTNLVRITFERAIVLTTNLETLIPEDEITEFLEFKNDVLRLASGEEQRIRLRKNPRQILEHRYIVEEGLVRAKLDLKLANLQHRTWAVGVWEHEVALIVAASTSDITLEVTDTSYSDFRAGGSLLIFVDDGVFEFQGILSVVGTTITLTGPLENPYPVGARVVPMRKGRLQRDIDGRRYPVNLTEIDLRFDVTDNDRDLADASAFASFEGRPLLDGYNFQGLTKPDGLSRDLVVLDPGSGLVYVDSDEIMSRQTTELILFAKTRADAWAIRRLLHYLGGRLVSFYLPTNREDLLVSETLVHGDDQLFIHFAGYTDNAQSRTPKDVIRLTRTNGTKLDRRVLSSVVTTDGLFETLILDALWPGPAGNDIDPEDVESVMFLQKVRLDTDSVRIDHLRGGRTMRVAVPIRAVLS